MQDLTQGLWNRIPSRLNARLQTGWAIEDQAKIWTQQPVPMISEHSAHSTPLPFGFRPWLWRYTFFFNVDVLAQRFSNRKETSCIYGYVFLEYRKKIQNIITPPWDKTAQRSPFCPRLLFHWSICDSFKSLLIWITMAALISGIPNSLGTRRIISTIQTALVSIKMGWIYEKVVNSYIQQYSEILIPNHHSNRRSAFQCSVLPPKCHFALRYRVPFDPRYYVWTQRVMSTIISPIALSKWHENT